MLEKYVRYLGGISPHHIMAAPPFILCWRQHLTDERRHGPSSVTCLWGHIKFDCELSNTSSEGLWLQASYQAAIVCKSYCRKCEMNTAGPHEDLSAVALTVSRWWIMYAVSILHNFLIHKLDLHSNKIIWWTAQFLTSWHNLTLLAGFLYLGI